MREIDCWLGPLGTAPLVGYLPQQCLYFLPLPHGHGALRPTLLLIFQHARLTGSSSSARHSTARTHTHSSFHLRMVDLADTQIIPNHMGNECPTSARECQRARVQPRSGAVTASFKGCPPRFMRVARPRILQPICSVLFALHAEPRLA